MNINVGWFIAAFAAYFIINIVVSLRVSKGTSGISGFALGQGGPVVLGFSFFVSLPRKQVISMPMPTDFVRAIFCAFAKSNGAASKNAAKKFQKETISF